MKMCQKNQLFQTIHHLKIAYFSLHIQIGDLASFGAKNGLLSQCELQAISTLFIRESKIKED